MAKAVAPFFKRVHWVSQRNPHGWARTMCGSTVEWVEAAQSYAMASGGKVPTSESRADTTCPACLAATHWKWKEDA